MQSIALRITNLKLLRTLSSNGWMKYRIQNLSIPVKKFNSLKYAGISSELEGMTTLF